jgi:hypothetical protein
LFADELRLENAEQAFCCIAIAREGALVGNLATGELVEVADPRRTSAPMKAT